MSYSSQYLFEQMLQMRLKMETFPLKEISDKTSVYCLQCLIKRKVY